MKERRSASQALLLGCLAPEAASVSPVAERSFHLLPSPSSRLGTNLSSSCLTRSLLCSVGASVLPPLDRLIPLLKQGSHGHPQCLGQEHCVGLARHVGGAPALHLPYEPAWHTGSLGELLDAPALRASR